MKMSLVMAFATFALCGPAFADEASDAQFTSEMQVVANNVVQIINNNCRGPKINDNDSGLTGNMSDDIRCQSISVAVLSCQQLGAKSGSFLEQVEDGQATFDAIQRSLDSSTGDDVGSSASALVLAQQAPSSTSPAQLLYTVYTSCVGLLGH